MVAANDLASGTDTLAGRQVSLDKFCGATLASIEA
jgi:hypothetical protein